MSEHQRSHRLPGRAYVSLVDNTTETLNRVLLIHRRGKDRSTEERREWPGITPHHPSIPRLEFEYEIGLFSPWDYWYIEVETSSGLLLDTDGFFFCSVSRNDPVPAKVEIEIDLVKREAVVLMEISKGCTVPLWEKRASHTVPALSVTHPPAVGTRSVEPVRQREIFEHTRIVEHTRTSEHPHPVETRQERASPSPPVHKAPPAPPPPPPVFAAPPSTGVQMQGEVLIMEGPISSSRTTLGNVVEKALEREREGKIIEERDLESDLQKELEKREQEELLRARENLIASNIENQDVGIAPSGSIIVEDQVTRLEP